LSLDKAIPRFVADVMLGSLSRWLRLFGFDTLYSNDFDDRELIKISIQDDRILLTRDHSLARSKLLKKVLLIHSDDIREQIKEVLSAVQCSSNLCSFKPRCPVCNGEIQRVEKDSIKALIPDYVVFVGHDFMVCISCGKIYWHGTHKKKIDELKRKILQEIDRTHQK